LFTTAGLLALLLVAGVFGLAAVFIAGFDAFTPG
jgi:hypothetical protein